jgi:hypothetical protein
LKEQLKRLGAEVHERRLEIDLPDVEDPVSIVHVTGVLAGESDDLLMLAAHYDTATLAGARFVGANDGASGPALVLEIGRVLAGQPRPYTIWLTFIDADAEAQEPDAMASTRLGSRSLAAELALEERLGDIRLAVFFNQVCDPQLTIARDLRSHVIHREVFWDTAAELGAGDAFAREDGFESPPGPHLSFLEYDMRRVVAIVDDRFGSGGPPGVLWRTEHDTLENCDPTSLGTVGLVTQTALHRISSRLEKIDRFAPAVPDAPPAHHSPGP